FSDPATDIILPLIVVLKHEAKFIGLALFDGSKYTGKDLNIPESTIYMLLANHLNKNSEIKVKVSEKGVPESNNYIYMNVLNVKRKFKVSGQDINDISSHIHLDLKIEVLEYPDNYLDSAQKIRELEKTISEKLT